MSIVAQNAAASWRIRRRNRSAIFTANCTPWSPGLVCSPGAVCQSNGLAWTTAEGGTTGSGPAPSNEAGNTVNDGGVVWTHTWLLLTQPPLI